MNTRPIYSDRTVGELVTEDFRKAGVLREFGIDFCCGGKKSLNEACTKNNLDSEIVIKALEELDNKPDVSNENFSDWEPDELVDYIVGTHHAYVRNKIPEISAYSRKVARVHGQHHAETIKISFIFDLLSTELNAHINKEENILFPYIKYLAKTQQDGITPEKPFFGSVQNPVSMMEADHDEAGKEMAKIESLSNGYTPPEDACPTFRILYKNLKTFQDDLHKHIHLENNILFPMALELEKSS
ncbi:MAG TPA: iron-sulfur cluster repair di-iron protein [Balneolales bacterium]|nr:iron-sulfur cluster repair di-iron protein [Balneolales bacterium]